jgi:hypothetical protein
LQDMKSITIGLICLAALTLVLVFAGCGGGGY